jgi:hypothetical protein
VQYLLYVMRHKYIAGRVFFWFYNILYGYCKQNGVLHCKLDPQSPYYTARSLILCIASRLWPDAGRHLIWITPDAIRGTDRSLSSTPKRVELQ